MPMSYVLIGLLIIGIAVADLEKIKFETNSTVKQDVILAFDVNEFQTYGDCDFSTTIIGETKVVKFNGEFKPNTLLTFKNEAGDEETIKFKTSFANRIIYKVKRGEMIDQRAYLGFEVKMAILDCEYLNCRKGEGKHSKEIFFEGKMLFKSIDAFIYDKDHSAKFLFTFSTSETTTIESSFNPINQEMKLPFLPSHAESEQGITATKKGSKRITFKGPPPTCLTQFKYVPQNEETDEIVTESMTVTFDWIDG